MSAAGTVRPKANRATKGRCRAIALHCAHKRRRGQLGKYATFHHTLDSLGYSAFRLTLQAPRE